MNNILLKIKDITAGYNDKKVLNDINLEIHENDFIGIIGPNGGGKTTLLKVILGLLKPFSGSIGYFNNGVPCKNLRIGYMPQQAQIDHSFPISVREVILSGMNAERKPLRGFTEEQKQRELKIEEQLGLGEIAKRPIGQISGGQRQRALLGRAIVSNPQLLVLDEPDAYVDKNFTHKLYSLLQEIKDRCAIIIVSHDIKVIEQNAKDIIFINRTLERITVDEIEKAML